MRSELEIRLALIVLQQHAVTAEGSGNSDRLAMLSGMQSALDWVMGEYSMLTSMLEAEAGRAQGR